MKRVSGAVLTLAILCLISTAATAADGDSGQSSAPWHLSFNTSISSSVAENAVPGKSDTLQNPYTNTPGLHGMGMDTLGQQETPWQFSLNASGARDTSKNKGSSDSTKSQTPGSLPSVATVRPAPMMGHEKFRYYLRSTYGPASFSYTALGTGIKQAQGSVREWGGGMEGYGKRYASSFGQKVVDRSVRIGLQGLLHEDPRYFASGRSGIWSRTIYAASEAFWVRTDSGGARPAFTRWVAHFSAAYISRRWRPDSYHSTSDYITSGLSSIGIDAAINIWSEFWPDTKRMLRH